MAKKVDFKESEIEKKKEAEVQQQEDLAGVQDIDLSATRKKRFRIDGDNNRMLELNTSDVGLLARLQETYPKLRELANKAHDDWPEDDEEGLEGESAEKTATLLKEIDKEMREAIDYIFDSNVSEVCAPDGTMFDPFGGRLRFDHIIDVISGLYENNLTSEVKKMTKNVNKHTSKYIN